jgi:DNA-binding beta-propeller fold protein YncE
MRSRKSDAWADKDACDTVAARHEVDPDFQSEHELGDVGVYRSCHVLLKGACTCCISSATLSANEGRNNMPASPKRFAIALLTTVVAVGTARAQSSYPCTETNGNLPNPYRQVENWAFPPRPWSPVNAVAVDPNNNLWAVDRCETDDCVPVIELGPDGKTLKNFGAGLFVEPHQAAIDRDGNLWVADAAAKGMKGMQVTKLGRDGRVLLKLGKPGQGAGQTSLDIFDSPTGVAVASNGDIYISEGHGEAKVNNSRIMVFTKDGKLIKTFATYGRGDGQLRSPHALAFDSQDHLYVADRGNSRVVIFDKDGKFLAAWKQFGRPSGVAVDKNDMLYVADSQSSDTPGAANYNPGCQRGIRVGRVTDGKVMYFIPPPVPPDPKMQPPIGIVVDGNGAIYAASDDQMDIKKYLKN